MPLIVSLVDWTWLRKVSEIESMSIETSKIEKQRKRDWKKWNRISINFGTTIKDAPYASWEYQKETKERKVQKKYLKQQELRMSSINVRHQITDPRNSKNTKQDKHSKIIPGNIIFKLQKMKIKKKS